jgi:hypothetical protein
MLVRPGYFWWVFGTYGSRAAFTDIERLMCEVEFWEVFLV